MKQAKLNEILKRQHYELVGKHSAVEICSWTKKSLLDKGVCYKQKFYGIKSHRCCQMTPAAGYCDQKCVFCWRAHEYNLGTKMPAKIDSPSEIIDSCIAAQRKKLSGFGGNEKVNRKKFEEAQNPTQWAISLTGEPTLYPKLGELISELNSRGNTTFLVTNGQHPEVLMKLAKLGVRSKELGVKTPYSKPQTPNSLPYQLYVSLDAPNEKLFKKVNVPLRKNAWKRLNKTLELLPKLNCRKVIRITLIKGLNDVSPEKYAKLILKAKPDFVEVKAYMFLGYSRKRLKAENMPLHKDVRAFAEKLAKELKCKILDEDKRSRIVLLKLKR